MQWVRDPKGATKFGVKDAVGDRSSRADRKLEIASWDFRVNFIDERRSPP
ncbi:hypothetical protein CKA32_003011 [Geitlerinema sp. FC II]|nr:hypothetical protein CKA32_003011 [Geitlerinema sp. FC II]